MMFKVQTLLVAMLLQLADANSPHRADRRLSQEYFLSYEPITTVTDHAAIDLDQKAIETQLAYGTDQGREAALKVYVEGAFSKSYAELTLKSGVPVDVGQDVTVFGEANDGTQLRGKTMMAVKTGDTVLLVQYHSTTKQATYSNCHVGGNPEPNTEGCFANTGTIEIGEIGEYEYSYNSLMNNYNARSLQSFSTEAKEKMYECPNCPYPTYNKFYSYYGSFDYGNQWILAAFNKGGTNFAKGNADFSGYGFEGTTEAIQKGTVYLNTWMYVNREMEDAVDDCEAECKTDQCNDDQVHAWDEAVAFYTGSEPKSTGDGGYLLYTLAQKRCENYGTCLKEGNEVGLAKVNSEIFNNFRQGKQNLLLGNCDVAKVNVKRITELMTVPLVQGTLRYAYTMDKQNDTREKAKAEGASFAASVLPLLDACNETDADTVYNNMRVGNDGVVSYSEVKAAFERNYECMGIACNDVGGLIDMVSEGYLAGAEPCGYVPPAATDSYSSSTSSSTSSTVDDGPNIGLAVGLSLGIVAALLLVALLISRKGDEKEYDGTADPDMA